MQGLVSNFYLTFIFLFIFITFFLSRIWSYAHVKCALQIINIIVIIIIIKSKREQKHTYK